MVAKKGPAGSPPAAAPGSAADGGAKDASRPDVAVLPFEEALAQLERIVDQLEEGSLPLEEALSRFEHGIHLSRHLERQLHAAETRVRKLVGGEPGAPALAPMGEGEPEEEAGDDADDPAGQDKAVGPAGGPTGSEGEGEGGDEDDSRGRLF